MDTSDSECFESADEEFYPEGEDVSKLATKCVVSSLGNDLTNLNLKNSPRNTNDGVAMNKVVDNILTTSESSTTKNLLEYNVTKGPKIEIIESIEENVDKQISETNIKDEDTSSSDDTMSQPIQLLETNKENNLKNKETERTSIENNLVKEVEKETVITSQNDCIIITHKLEELSKNENTTANQDLGNENSDNEENMWENDDWEAIVDDKDTEKQTTHTNKKDPNLVTETAGDKNMWDNDDWEPFETVEHDNSFSKQQDAPETSWSGWGNWGVSSIINTATQGVSTLTNQVSQGLSTVLETGMGIPDPKELARQDRVQESTEQQTELDQGPSDRSNLGFGFGNLSNLVSGVSHITKFVENTGSKVITGGLDTLETIGKKTMEVLQEGDPGLKNKRALLKLEKDKPILSQVLREAKERSERENKALQETHLKKKLNYETLFDDYHGLVHLEALEMLSKQCDIKLQTLSENCTGNELTDFQETMDQIKELCELPDEDDDETTTFDDIKEKIQQAVKDINVRISYDKLILAWEDTEKWLNNLKIDFCNETEIHQEALQILARLTAIAVEQFHKCGELLLVKEHRSTVDEADSLVQLTMAVTSLIGLVAAKFSDKLNMKSTQTANKDSVNELITNVFYEAGNSSSYVQDAFQLLVPVLQVGAV